MKKISLLVFAILLLAGGAGLYSFLNKPAQAANDAVSHEEKADKKSEETHAAEAVSFIEMKPLVLPILDKNGVSQVVSLVVSLEVSNEEAKKEVERLSPRLTDAYIQDMYGTLSRQAAMEGGLLQVNYIKDRLNRVTQSVIGEDKVKDVLLQVVQQRPV
jgi:flagellar FliL protein